MASRLVRTDTSAELLPLQLVLSRQTCGIDVTIATRSSYPAGTSPRYLDSGLRLDAAPPANAAWQKVQGGACMAGDIVVAVELIHGHDLGVASGCKSHRYIFFKPDELRQRRADPPTAALDSVPAAGVSMLLKRDFALMARYNQWMNAAIYDAATTLDEADLRADRGAFFGSILATLHHIYTADVLWMKRFADDHSELASLADVRAMAVPELVRGITQPDFQRLRTDREAMDAIIIAFTDEADEALYAQTLHYTDTAGVPHAKPFALVLRHFFNHQTHHRGQATTLFSQLGVDVGVTDLSVLIPDAVQE